MTLPIRMRACAAAMAVVAAACGGPPPLPAGAMFIELQQNISLMLSYDGSGDGAVSREEVETALRREFTVSDADRDGRIDFAEMQAENGRRFRAAGTGASPLIDWNRSGQIEFEEFGTTARSLFAELDRDRNGALEGNELQVPRLVRGPRMPPPIGVGDRGPGPGPYGGPAFPSLRN